MKLIDPNYVKDDDFEIETINRSTILYREDLKEVSLEREAGYDPEYYTAVYLSVANEWNVPKGEKLDKNQKNRITENLKKAFAFIGTRLKIE